MRVDNFKCITFLTSGQMKDENVLFGKFLGEGCVKLAISVGTDWRRLPSRK